MARVILQLNGLGVNIMSNFIGRNKELMDLKQALQKKTASFIVIRGRRRIGKSRLTEEFGKEFKRKYYFTGLPPEPNANASAQRSEFIRQMHEQSVPCIASEDWGTLFSQLAGHCESEQVLIVLDEITWMCADDKTFLGKLKIAWDSYFKKNDQLILIVSGSNSAWIQDNILSNTGFYGRITYRKKLEELALPSCNEFWGNAAKNISAFEKLKMLSITGGIPRYLEEINPKETAEENIFRLCYQQEGFLFNEFDDLFRDLFEKRDKSYKEIIRVLVEGNTSLNEISSALNRIKGGDLSQALEELSEDSFINRYYSWNIKTGKETERISQYRVVDNYFRFYVKYILPHKHKIEINAMESLPNGWESILGLQFESLVLNNRLILHKLLNINGNEIVYSNPYIQTATKARQGCQVDYMVQTKFNVLYLCEIKFRKNIVGSGVIKDIEDKIKKLKIPRGFSMRPVLIHVNGVSDELLAEDYFSGIIDFSEFLNSKT